MSKELAKQAVALAMAAALSCTGLAACSSNAPEDGSSSSASASSSSSSSAAVDKEPLGKLVDEASDIIDKADDKDAVKGISEALEAAEKVFGDDGATDEEVEQAAKSLEEAIAAYKKAADAASEETEESAAEPAEGPADDGNAAPNGGDASTSTPAASTPANTGSASNAGSSNGNSGNAGSTPAQKERRWVDEQGHWETVTVQAAWDEPIYESHTVCTCGLDLTAAGIGVMKHSETCGGGLANVQVQVGTMHHDAVTEQRWVVDTPGHYE